MRIRRRSVLGVVAGFAGRGASSAAFQEERRVVAGYGDGIPLSPAEYVALLSRLGAGVKEDLYSQGGVVEGLEERIASALGKEMAVWMPTGTLANHLAVRLLAGSNRRVLVQGESHLYRDSGDCAQALSGLNLVPLAPGRATFTLEEAMAAANAASDGRVAVGVGAVQVETPVRRQRGEQFDFGEMTRISKWARERGVGLHLDGARLFVESAYSGRSLKEYGALFDTVYISMYKYFNAAGGAVLAGPKKLLDGLYHTRRMFGGGVYRQWPSAAVALHFLQGFEERFRKAVAASEAVITSLSRDPAFEVERVKNGTNIFAIRTPVANAAVYNVRLQEQGVEVRTVRGQQLVVQVNETWAWVEVEDLAKRFRTALG